MSRHLHISVLATVAMLVMIGCSRIERGHPIPVSGSSLEQKTSTEDAPPTLVPSPEPVRVASNVPMTRLASGQKPPQFVLFSFDGVGLTPNWDMFLNTAQRVDARSSALMTGLYFLTDSKAGQYQGPGHPAGEAAIAFGGGKEDVLEQIEYLNRTWLAGHEMGTHYVGHFCKGSGSHGAQWTTTDWTHELSQFYSLMTNWRSNNTITTGPDLLFGPRKSRAGEPSAWKAPWTR